MALLFFDPWDFYTTIGQVWDSSTGTITISSTSARFTSTNGKGVRYATSANSTKNFGANPGPTIFVAFAMRTASYPGSGARALLQLIDVSTAQVSVALDSLGRIGFYRGTGSSGTLLANSGSFIYGTNIWHRVEVKIVLASGTGGSVEMRIDGNTSPVISVSSLNTISTANAYFNVMKLGDVDGGISTTIDFDDLIVNDNTGGNITGYLGDRKLITSMPNGAGGSTQWTPNGAGTNFGCVSEIPADDDTTYVSDNNAGDQDLYTIQAMTFTGNADFVAQPYRARKDDANVHTIKSTYKSNATSVFGSTKTLASNYQYFGMDEATYVDPNTSAAWTQSGVNAMQVGPNLVS